MKKYCVQLKLLIWKNYILRKRNKLRCLVEVAWPIIMFLILLALHKLGTREHIPNCYFISRAMPTVGGIAFLRSALCTFGNNCNSEENAGDPFKGSFIDVFMAEAEKYVNKWGKKFNIRERMSYDIKTRKYKRNFFENDRIVREVFKMSEKARIVNITKYLPLVDLTLCGPNVLPIKNQADQLEKPGSRMQKVKIEYEPAEWENDTTKYCNELMRNLESSIHSRVIFRMLKPFVRGKIVYSPNAPIVAKIFKELDETLKSVKTIKDILKEEVDSLVAKIEEGLKEGEWNDRFLQKAKIKDYGKNSSNGLKNDKFLKRDPKFSFNDVLGYLNTSYLVLKFLDCFDLNRFVPMPNEEKAVKESMKWLKTDRLFALIVFVGLSENASELPPSVKYKIRLAPDKTVDTTHVHDIIYRPRLKKHPLEDMKYITGGFAYIQNMIEGAVIKLQTGREKLPGIFLQETPYPCHVSDTFRDAISRTLPMFMILSWVFTFIMLVKRIVSEKENCMKESMRIMGVRNSQHWIAWFVDGFVPLMIISIILSVILVKGNVTPRSSIVALWIFLTAFTIPTITLAFLISSIFFRTSYATAVAAFVFFLTYLPYPPLSSHDDEHVETLKLSLCIFSNVGFGLGCTWIANMEELGVGARLENFNYTPQPGSSVTLALLIWAFLIDALLYLLVAVYIENVFPGRNNIGLPFYYFLTKTYWCGYKPHKKSGEFVNVEFDTQNDPHRYEAEPQGLRVGVSVQHLTKEFDRGKKKKRAVNDLSINFYENQITSFLGHNGAGKTTSVSMMTGMLSITSGKVFLYEKDIEKDFQAVRQDIAFCKQENVLLNDLNVEEHFYLFSRLRNRTSKEAKIETKNLINDLGLVEKSKTPVNHLSGGMKRKLNVGMAFIGGPKIVFLDEPTAGVDPIARRAIWDLLVKYKSGRTIILTTHFLDEADLLGDRIAIISNGELQCCGSSLFLKSKLGRGYFLTVESSLRTVRRGRKFFSDDLEEVAMSDQAKKIFEVIKKIIPQVVFVEEVGTEMTYVLPPKSNVNHFEKLFKSLEDNKPKLNFTSFGITHTSLDEIFIKIVEEAETKEIQKEESFQSARSEKSEEKLAEEAVKKKKHVHFREGPKIVKEFSANGFRRGINVGSILLMSLRKNACFIYFCQFFALFYVRIISHFRNYKLLCVEIFLPTIFMIIALLLGKLTPKIHPMPPLTIYISSYENSIIFYTLNNVTDPQTLAYEEALLGPYGLGPECVVSPEKCSMKSIPQGSLQSGLKKNINEKCNCDNEYFSCPSDVKNMKPPSAKMSIGDTLYNLTNQDLNSWLISKEIEMSKVRYGGVSLGVNSPYTGLTVLDFLEIFELDTLIINIFTEITRRGSVKKFLSSLDEVVMQDILNFAVRDPSKAEKFFKEKNISDNINIWYNDRALHSVPAFLNGVSNLILRASLPKEKDPSKYSITVINHPLPSTIRQLEDQMEVQMSASLLTALSVVWALSVIPATLSLYLVSDRCSGFKHLQIVNGVNNLIYWTCALLWDYFIYTVNIIIILAVYLSFDERAYIGEKGIKVFVALLFAYGFASVCFIYPFTFFFGSSSSCFIFIATYNIFVGLITLLTHFALNLLTDWENPYYIYTIFSVFHQFCFGKSLMNMALEHVRNQALENFGMKSKSDYFAWDFTGKYLLAMFLQGCVYIIATLLIQYRVVGRIIDRKNENALKKMKAMNKFIKGREEDDDVRKERERVESGRAKEDGDAVIIDNLSKVYFQSKAPAVDHLSFGLKSGECFGLLGMNGAGKTTTFKMLTGYISPSGGDALIGDYSIKTSKRKAKLLLGYCPQFDALSSYLTPEEHFSFFCMVRGITGSLKTHLVEESVKRLELTKHKNKIIKSLSGGNKRKVNTAIALLGDPTIVLLDEPTSGMDVHSRRFLWNCILNVVQEGRCVVLTTHSMEECRALCSPISIMVNGKLTCFGSCSHLKHKYNEGYCILVRCFTSADIEKVKIYITKSLPKAMLVQVHYLQMKFKLAPDVSVGLAFRILNQAKMKKIIEDYSISQTTLETIFLNLAKSTSLKELESSTSCLKCWYNCQRKFRPTQMI